MKATDIQCPSCGAAPGKFCKRRLSRGRSHRTRRDLAKQISHKQRIAVLSMILLSGEEPNDDKTPSG